MDLSEEEAEAEVVERERGGGLYDRYGAYSVFICLR